MFLLHEVASSNHTEAKHSKPQAHRRVRPVMNLESRNRLRCAQTSSDIWLLIIIKKRCVSWLSSSSFSGWTESEGIGFWFLFFLLFYFCFIFGLTRKFFLDRFDECYRTRNAFTRGKIIGPSGICSCLIKIIIPEN